MCSLGRRGCECQSPYSKRDRRQVETYPVGPTRSDDSARRAGRRPRRSRSVVMSANGSPSTRSRSASSPGASRPLRSREPAGVGAERGAEARTSAVETPPLGELDQRLGQDAVTLAGVDPGIRAGHDPDTRRDAAGQRSWPGPRASTPVLRIISSTAAGATAPGAKPSVGQTTTPESTRAATTSSSTSTPVSVKNEQCSMASTPAARAFRMRVEGMRVGGHRQADVVGLGDDSGQLVGRELRLAHVASGVLAPPLAMIFTTSAPRAARSRTAARSAATPGLAAHVPAVPPGMVIGGPLPTTVGSAASRPLPSRHSITAQRRSPRSRTVVTPAASWALSDALDHGSQLVVGEVREAIQRAERRCRRTDARGRR